jgi:PDZ domain-containing protein
VRLRILAAVGVLAATGAYASGAVPCALVTLQPACQLAVTGGPVLDTADLVRIEGRGSARLGTADGEGRLLATTIEVSEPDGWVDWLAGHRDPTTAMIARVLLVPDGQGLDAVATEGRRAMEESQRRAAGLALHAVGLIDDPGVALEDWPVTITFATDGVGGPSAGLMIALAVAARVGPDDLAAGLTIAGTGVLDATGRVVGVGGIDHKLRSVTRTGGAPRLDAFLLPVADLALARRTIVGRDVLLVPVTDLDAALVALAELRAGREPQGAVLLSASAQGSR